MSMKEILAELDANLLRGMVYTSPGETTKEREQTLYCLSPGSHCHTCGLVDDDDRDCRNNPVVDRESCRQCQYREIHGVEWKRVAWHPDQLRQRKYDLIKRVITQLGREWSWLPENKEKG